MDLIKCFFGKQHTNKFLWRGQSASSYTKSQWWVMSLLINCGWVSVWVCVWGCIICRWGWMRGWDALEWIRHIYWIADEEPNIRKISSFNRKYLYYFLLCDFGIIKWAIYYYYLDKWIFIRFTSWYFGDILGVGGVKERTRVKYQSCLCSFFARNIVIFRMQ